MDCNEAKDPKTCDYIRATLDNKITLSELEAFRKKVDAEDLSIMIQKIYDLNNQQVYQLAALAKVMAMVDGWKNAMRNKRFNSKIKAGFRKPGNKIILAEGDSWFNYPVILSDVLDWLGMENDLAVYSLANGGDWLLNMLSARKYVEELSVMHPDVFLISAGGNDLVGKSRVGAIVDPSGKSPHYEKSEFATMLIQKAKDRPKPIAEYKDARFKRGSGYLSREFFGLLLFFHLQYYYLINGILRGGTEDPSKGKFPGIKIVTQGYDYVLPSNALKFGPNPLRWYRPFIRLFLGHGSWLKTPMQLRGILEKDVQQDIVYAMIYLFNEMMIFTGDLFCQMPSLGKPVFHVDSRGSVGQDGWTDELHPLPKHFRNTALTFADCIHGKTSEHGQVYVVQQLHPA